MKSNRLNAIVVVLAVLLPMAACSKDPEVAKRDHVARADRYVKDNKLPEAVIEYQNAIKLDARYGEARFKLGEVYERQGDIAKAYSEFVRAGDLLPGRDDVQLKAGQYLLAARRFDDARRVAEALVKKSPKNTDAQIVLANALAGLQDLPAAISELEGAIQGDPTKTGAYLNLATFQMINREPRKAEAVLREALAKDPGSVEARLVLMNLFWAEGDLAKAEAMAKEALTIQPKHQLANRTLALFYMQSGRAKDAETPLRAIAESTKSASARLSLAAYYLGMNRSAEAVPLLTALTSDKEGRVPASLLLSRWEYANGQKEQAQNRLDALLIQEPRNTKVLLLKAELLGADGKVDQGLVQAEAAAAANPKLPAAQFTIGLLSMQKRDSERALKAFNEVLRIDPSAINASLQVAKLQLASGSADVALKTLDEVVRKQPRNLDARLTLVRALVRMGDITRAQTEAAALVKDAPKSADAHALGGTIAVIRKDYPAARAGFARALELDANSMTALAGLIALDLSTGKQDDARARVAKRLAANPLDPAMLETAARAYMSMGDAGSAEQNWRKLIEVQPDNLAAYGALGQVLYSQGRLDDARREFERIAERQPAAVGAHTVVGMILQMQGRVPEAQMKYERVIEINPNAAVAANNLAWLYAEQNVKLDTALQLAQTAKRRMPESAEAEDTLGWVYYKKGLATLAIASFERCVAKEPANRTYLYHQGLAQLKNGDTVKARESLQKALAGKADFPEAADARKALAGLG